MHDNIILPTAENTDRILVNREYNSNHLGKILATFKMLNVFNCVDLSLICYLFGFKRINSKGIINVYVVIPLVFFDN